jgi:hypothetical protein
MQSRLRHPVVVQLVSRLRLGSLLAPHRRHRTVSALELDLAVLSVVEQSFSLVQKSSLRTSARSSTSVHIQDRSWALENTLSLSIVVTRWCVP